MRGSGFVSVAAILALVASFIPGPAFSASIEDATPAQLAYGKHLSRNCVFCHRIGAVYRGNFTGSARITGLDPLDFMAKIAAKVDDADPIMRQIVAELEGPELEALAFYLSTVEND